MHRFSKKKLVYRKERFNIKSVLKILKPNCKIIELEKITEGAACTTLLAKKYIDNGTNLNTQFDGKTFNKITTAGVRKYLNNTYYQYYLQETK